MLLSELQFIQFYVISVKTNGKVWVLDRSVFLTIMIRTAQEQLEGNIRFLQRVSVLQKLPEPKDHVLAKISDLIRIVRRYLKKILLSLLKVSHL